MNHQRYRPITSLASGGMADVFLGLQTSETGFTRLCAIKKVQTGENKPAEDFIAMFGDEARICQSLHHANIVQVLDFSIVDGSYALVMEYVPGVNLRELLLRIAERNQKLPIPFAIYIAEEIAKGLSYVHSRTDSATGEPLGIIHRDISPSNILISFEGEIKITDFGIAKAASSSTQTQVGVVKGKFQYMSPEQFRAEATDHRIDIYALGCILWEMVAGKKLLEPKNDAELINLLTVRTDRPRLSAVMPAINPELDDVVARCLEADPQRRYTQAQDLHRDLSRCSQAVGVTSVDLKDLIRDCMSAEFQRVTELMKMVAAKTDSEIKVSSSGSISPQENNGQDQMNLREGKLLQLDKSGGSISSLSSSKSTQGTRSFQQNGSAVLQASVQPIQWNSAVIAPGQAALPSQLHILRRRRKWSLPKEVLVFVSLAVIATVVVVLVSKHALGVDLFAKLKLVLSR